MLQRDKIVMLKCSKNRVVEDLKNGFCSLKKKQKMTTWFTLFKPKGYLFVKPNSLQCQVQRAQIVKLKSAIV